MTDAILYERADAFARVTLNLPDTGNRLTNEMLDDLTAAFDRAGGEDGLKGVILRGAGPDFCLGRDPRPDKANPPSSAFEAHGRIMGRILGVYAAARRVPVPVVALVQGQALGFGTALIGACDMAQAEAGSVFALPEMQHGIAPTLAISALIPRVSTKAVADLVFTGREIDAEAALSFGIVTRLLPAGGLDAAETEIRAALSGYDVTAIQTVKRYLATAPLLPTDAASDLAGYTLATVSTRGR